MPDTTDAKSIADQELPASRRWRLTAGLTHRSRTSRFRLFMSEMRPTPESNLMDVGVIDTAWRSSNFFEANYPWPSQITAVSIDPVPTFQRHHPEVKVVIADGKNLPFPDQSFEIGFSNAVIEHVGSRDAQRRFVAEMLRTCRRVFIATPNARFPIDPHTLLPFLHWLPTGLWHRLLRAVGHESWADLNRLNPLDARALRSLFPSTTPVRIVRQRLLGLTSVIIAIAGTEGPAMVAPSAGAPTDAKL
jgi:hypothetical protein